MKSILTLLIAFTAFNAHAQSIHLLQTGSGTSFSVVTGDPVDLDPPLNDQGLATSTLQGSLGNATDRGVSELEDWDQISFCDDVPNGLLFRYVVASFVGTSASGDQLFRTLDPDQTSTLCFDFINGASVFNIHFVFIGGTGRFEGASGNAVATGSAQFIADGLTAFQVRLEGNIDR